ncbi:hypothetical protein B0H66DRAFT_539336 [Apodospora peruviana]|uniref:Uncharacterized protein n=1 Tax=Apodospora peruviana TaxID=516989 RepID=A0AAE0IPI6_9PEZI|nr:hypothetical protein B0H66DRAFT_539336 [Apodospora peruviana]
MKMLRGLSLEIHSFSPSDYQHRFGDFRLKDDYPLHFTEKACADERLGWVAECERAKQMKLERHHDFNHGWEKGTQFMAGLGARKRVTKTLFPLYDGRGRLPEVPAITAFTVRRQSYRGIDIPSLRKILAAFPNLEYFIHEPWYSVTREPELQRRFDEQYLLLLYSLPKTNKKLRHVKLLQNFSKDVESLHGLEGQSKQDHSPRQGPGRALTRTTRLFKVEILSAACLIDALDFFLRIHRT